MEERVLHRETDTDALEGRLLSGVSRTFALTIPELPISVRRPVGNAYLLCRIADTIEDETSLSVDDKQLFHGRFVNVVAGEEAADSFARDLAPRLSGIASAAERELVELTPAVVQHTRSLPDRQRAALERCVRIMCAGMPPFQRTTGLSGLASMADMDRYCYYVAGVVGEMLTELFCSHAADIEARREILAPLATSFGQGLQMTNIIKDFWSDRERGVCWFPRDVFERAGANLASLEPHRDAQALAAGLEVMIGVAHGHLRNALDYTLAIPPRQAGIRRFCLWALGLAVLTLRKVHASPEFLAGQTVKISRNAVRATVAATSAGARSNGALRLMFRLAAGPLPVVAATAPGHPGLPIAVR